VVASHSGADSAAVTDSDCIAATARRFSAVGRIVVAQVAHCWSAFIRIIAVAVRIIASAAIRSGNTAKIIISIILNNSTSINAITKQGSLFMLLLHTKEHVLA